MNTFDDIFQQKANSHEAGVPPGVWNKIIREKKKRRFIFFLLSLVVLLCGVGMLGYFNLYRSKQANQISFSKNESEAENKNRDTTIPVLDNTQPDQQKTPEKVVKTNISSNGEAAIKAQTSMAEESEARIKNIAGKTNVNDVSKTIASSYKPGAENEEENNDQALTARTSNGVIKYDKTSRPLSIKNNSDKTIDVIPGRKNIISIKRKGKAKINTQQPSLDNLENSSGEKNIAANRADEKPDREIVPEKNTLHDSGSALIRKADFTGDSLPKKLVLNTALKTGIEAPKKHTSKYPWFVDLNASPVLPFGQYETPAAINRTLSLNNSTTEFSGKLAHTGIDPSVAFALSVRKALSKKISAGAGIRYLQLKEDIVILGNETKTQYNIVDSLVNTASGPELVKDTVKTTINGTRTINATNSYAFISIPVFLQYNFMQKPTWRLAVTTGGFINVYNKYKNEIDRKAGAELISSRQSNENKKGISLALFGGILFGKSITKKIEFSLTPIFAWNLLNNNNNLLNKRIHTAGINVGLSYKIN